MNNSSKSGSAATSIRFLTILPKSRLLFKCGNEPEGVHGCRDGFFRPLSATKPRRVDNGYTPMYIDRIHKRGDIMQHTETREAAINIRALRAQRDLIDKAAAVRNKTRSDFMLEAACQEAENVLLDRRLFHLKDEEYEAFESALKTPVSENPALRKLLAQKSPWEG